MKFGLEYRGSNLIILKQLDKILCYLITLRNKQLSFIFLLALTAFATIHGSTRILLHFIFLCAFDVGARLYKTVNVSCIYP